MSATSDQRGPVELLADEFLARCMRGEKPTIKEYCGRHPDLADEIRDVFDALLMVEDLKPGSGDVSGSLGDSVRVNGNRLQQVGDYRILCEIGRGGMGVVYEAEQQALGESHIFRGGARARAGQPTEAAADLRRALELYARLPALSVAQQVDRSRALALLAGLGADAKSGVTRDEVKTFADQSVAVLAGAVKAGWALPSELKEPDFDALRGRANFQKLFAEVQAKAEKRGESAPPTRVKK